MPQNTSVSGRVTHTVADLTGRTDEEIRLLIGVAVPESPSPSTLRTVRS